MLCYIRLSAVRIVVAAVTLIRWWRRRLRQPSHPITILYNFYKVWSIKDRTACAAPKPVAVLKLLMEAVRRKGPQLWTNQSWVLHHDNAPAHSSFLVRSFLAKNETTVVPQPPYSPDMAPADFFLFPKLKSTLKWRRFNTIDESQKNSTNESFAIPKEAFQKAFQSWQKRWERLVASEGNYVEGDKLE